VCFGRHACASSIARFRGNVIAWRTAAATWIIISAANAFRSAPDVAHRRRVGECAVLPRRQRFSG